MFFLKVWSAENITMQLCLPYIISLHITFVSSKAAKSTAEKGSKGIVRPGDIILGGMFPVHFGVGDSEESYQKTPNFPGCIHFFPRGLRFAMAMIFAIDEINHDNSLIQNNTLGYVIHDSCMEVPKTMDATLDYLQDSEPGDFKSLQGVIGATASTISVTMAEHLGLFYIPQVSYGSACKCFSDKSRFPSFTRTVPSDKNHASAIVHMVKKFGWKYVGTLAVDDDFGRTGSAQFIKEAEQNGICIAFQKLLPKAEDANVLGVLSTMVNNAKSFVTLLYMNDANLYPFAEELVHKNMTSKMWIASTGWATSLLLGSERYSLIFQGSIGFTYRRGEIKGFREYLEDFQPIVVNEVNNEKRMIDGFSNLDASLQSQGNRERNTKQCQHESCDFERNISVPLVFGRNEILIYVNENEFPCFTSHILFKNATRILLNKLYFHEKFKFSLWKLNFTGILHILEKSEEWKTSFECNNHLPRSESYLISPQKTEFKGRILKKSEDFNNSEKTHPVLNKYILELWEATFGCTWKYSEVNTLAPCTGKENLREVYSPFTDVSQLRFTYNTYTAVYSVAYALQDLQTCKPGVGNFENGSCATITNFKPWQLLYYLRKVQFKNSLGGIMQFDENGDPPAVYELINWQKTSKGGIRFVIVGGFDSSALADEQFQVNMDKIEWKGGMNKPPESVCSTPCQPGMRKIYLKGEPICCFDCVPCGEKEFSNVSDSQECFHCPEYFLSNKRKDYCVPMPEDYLTVFDPLALTFSVIAGLGIVAVMAVVMLMYFNQKLLVVKSMHVHVLGLLLMTLAFSFSSSFAFMGRPTNSVCQIRESLALIFISLAVSCIMSLIAQVVNTSPGALLKSKAMEVMVHLKEFVVGCISFLPQLSICILWAILGKPQTYHNTEDKAGTIILECRGTSTVWAVSALAYLGMLLMICLGFALKIRNIPSTYNEAKLITFSMLSCLLVCLAFVPAYSSTQGKFKVATEIFAIIAMTYGIFGCIFVPICYIIIFKPTQKIL